MTIITKCLPILFFFTVAYGAVLAEFRIQCYQCNGTADECDWDTQSVECPDPDDMCVVVIERTSDDRVKYFQDCLSYIDNYRKDIPLNRERGCRPAKFTKNGNDCSTNIRTSPPNETQINTYEDETVEIMFCFCRFQNDCTDEIESGVETKHRSLNLPLFIAGIILILTFIIV